MTLREQRRQSASRRRHPLRCGTLTSEIHAKGAGPWVLLASALATDRRIWSRQIGWLAKRFRVVVYDHPGHGDSVANPANDGFTLEDLAEDVIRMMDALGINQAAFLGLSLGGSVGLTLSLRHPDRVSRLACCCARGDSPAQYQNIWRDRIRKVTDSGVRSIVDETVSRWFAVMPSEGAADERIALARAMVEETSPAGYIGCASALTRMVLTESLSTMTIPVHYVSGEADAAIPPAIMEQMHKLTPGSRHSVIPGAGHLVHLDQPDLFDSWLADWLSSLD